VTVDVLINAYRPTVDALKAAGSSILSAFEQQAVEARTAAFVASGAPTDLASGVVLFRPMTAAVNIADLAKAAALDPVAAGRLYFATGGAFGFDRLRAAAAAIRPSDPYERQALRGLIFELMNAQLARARSIAALTNLNGGASAETAIEAWVEPRRAAVERARRTISDIEQASDRWSFAKLTIANAALREAGA